jgi:hypothetical protein
MEAHIFAEDSKTTAEEKELQLKDYYQGLFETVSDLHDELSKSTDANLHILSEEFGVAHSTEYLSSLEGAKQSPVGFDGMVKQGQSELLNTATEADVMVILLSAGVFDQVVQPQWREIANSAKPGSIWCLSAAESSLDSIDVELLESKGCTVIIYPRVGVARIGADTRDRLLSMVKDQSEE